MVPHKISADVIKKVTLGTCLRLQLNLHIIYIFILFVQFAYNVHVPCVTWFKPGNCKAPLF